MTGSGSGAEDSVLRQMIRAAADAGSSVRGSLTGAAAEAQQNAEASVLSPVYRGAGCLRESWRYHRRNNPGAVIGGFVLTTALLSAPVGYFAAVRNGGIAAFVSYALTCPENVAEFFNYTPGKP